MVDIQTEDDIERLRQVAVLQDAEIAKLHERISVIAAENEKLRQTKQGRLQRELNAVKDHLAKLEKMQFGASSEKRGRDEKRKSKKRRRKRRKRSGPTPQPELEKQVEWFKLDEPDQICPECGVALEEVGNLAEESEMIDVVERKFVVKRVNRQKYTCRDCGHIETTYLGIKHWIFGADVVGMDETTWRLMKKGRTKTWQMWAIRGRGAMWFALRDSRSGTTAAKLLEGFDGWLVTDGYRGYDRAVRRVEGEIRHAGCCTHRA